MPAFPAALTDALRSAQLVRMGKRILQAVLLLLFTAAMFILIFSGKDQNRKAELERIASESYDSVFLSMFPIENYEAADFTHYRAITPYMSSYCIQDAGELKEFLDTVLTSGNEVSHIYVGVDPYKIWANSRKKLTPYSDSLDLIMDYTAAFTEINFEFLLAYPSLEEWLGAPEGRLEQALDSYRFMVAYFNGNENVSFYYFGDQEWLIANPHNYAAGCNTNKEVSRTIMLNLNKNEKYWISAENMEAHFSALTGIVESRLANPPRYPDYSGKTFVFLGDSIMEYLPGSLSISGVVGSLTGADTYNCGYGGGNAALLPDQQISFPGIVDSLLTGDLSMIPADKAAYTGITDFRSKGNSSDSLCFFINFGLNDYFNGCPLSSNDPYDITTYTGALRTGVVKLKEAYPNASIVLLAPSFTIYFNNGTEKKSSVGGVLTDYVEAVVSLAEELDVKCINHYEELGINEENYLQYLSDGCHPNEAGGFYIGNHMIDRLENWMIP